MTRRRLTVLGGGSAFTPAMAAACADAAADLPALDVVLWGRHAGRLAAVAEACSRLAAAQGRDQRWIAEPQLDRALHGTDAVLCQVRIGGFAGRSADATFPLAHGLPGDETIGPGGLASAMRAVAPITALARRATALAPAAPFVLTSNPLGILLRALAAVRGLAAFGLCELPEHTLQRAAAPLGRATDDLIADYVGMNHQGAFTAVHTADGDDLLPTMLAVLAARSETGESGVDGSRMHRDGLLWLPYARLHLHRDRVVQQAITSGRDRGRELAGLSERLHAIYAQAPSTTVPGLLATREMPWYAMAVVPALAALFDGRPRRLALSMRNDGHLPWLPDDAIVEKFGPQVPLRTSPPPPRCGTTDSHRGLRELLREIDAFERAALAAALDPTRTRVATALRRCPGGLPARVDVDRLVRDTLAAAPTAAAEAAP